MKNVLVTGGAGFIGSHLCKRLFDQGCNVVSLDNYSTGTSENHVTGVEYRHMNTSKIFELGGIFDTIFHLGEYSRVEQSFYDIRKVMESNVIGTLEVIEYARSSGAKLIYAGSSTKFGDIGSNSSPYAFTKASNTELVKNYNVWHGLNYAITYFYNVYGPNEIEHGSYATVVAKFAKFAKEGKSIQVTAPGTQLRNFTHVDDIIDGLMLVGVHGHGDGYGIGSSESFSILELAAMFDAEVVMMPEKQGNRMTAKLVTERTEQLGWTSKRHLKDYINSLVA